jgi:hypothetical protein
MNAAKYWFSVLLLSVCMQLALSPSRNVQAGSRLPAPGYGQQADNNPAGAQESAAPPQPDPNHPVASPDETERITLSPGMVISVRIADKVDSSHGHSGDLLTGMVDPSLMVNNRVVIPRGTEAHVRMVEDKKGGHLLGKAEVQLELISLVMNGRKLDVESDAYKKDKGTVAAKVEGAAPSSAGAGTDMALGSGPGAAASPVIAVFRAAKVELSPGKRIEFTLTAPFTFNKPAATDKPATGGE